VLAGGILLHPQLAAAGLAALLLPAQKNFRLIGISGLFVSLGLSALKAFPLFAQRLFLVLAL